MRPQSAAEASIIAPPATKTDGRLKNNSSTEPFWLAISTIVANVDRIRYLLRTVLTLRVPAPPDWLGGVPLVGVPSAEVLTALMFMLCLAQIGASVVLVP